MKKCMQSAFLRENNVTDPDFWFISVVLLFIYLFILQFSVMVGIFLYFTVCIVLSWGKWEG